MNLAERVNQHEEALVHVKRPQGLLPICSYCKKICDDEKRWHEIEICVLEHSEAQFSHGICLECMKTLSPGYDGCAKPGSGGA